MATMGKKQHSAVYEAALEKVRDQNRLTAQSVIEAEREIEAMVQLKATLEGLPDPYTCGAVDVTPNMYQWSGAYVSLGVYVKHADQRAAVLKAAVEWGLHIQGNAQENLPHGWTYIVALAAAGTSKRSREPNVSISIHFATGASCRFVKVGEDIVTQTTTVAKPRYELQCDAVEPVESVAETAAVGSLGAPSQETAPGLERAEEA